MKSLIGSLMCLLGLGGLLLTAPMAFADRFNQNRMNSSARDWRTPSASGQWYGRLSYKSNVKKMPGRGQHNEVTGQFSITRTGDTLRMKNGKTVRTGKVIGEKKSWRGNTELTVEFDKSPDGKAAGSAITMAGGGGFGDFVVPIREHTNMAKLTFKKDGKLSIKEANTFVRDPVEINANGMTDKAVDMSKVGANLLLRTKFEAKGGGTLEPSKTSP